MASSKRINLFLHKNCKFIVCPRPSNSISNIQSMTYQENFPYTTTIVQTKFENSLQLETDNNYMHKA